MAWHSVGGTEHAGVVTYHRLDDVHTRVTLQLGTAPEGIVETLGDKLGLVTRRAKGDVERFREYIESRGAESGGYREEITPPGAGGNPDPDTYVGVTDVEPTLGGSGPRMTPPTSPASSSTI